MLNGGYIKGLVVGIMCGPFCDIYPENLMNSVFVLAFVGLFSLLHTTTLLANDVEEQRADASQFYSESKFKKAYKIYFSLAKAGDYYSQNKISQMYAAGKGVKADLAEAYAWSVLAAESGVEGMTEKSDTLLQEADDRAKAEKRAAKLERRYSKQALEDKAAKKERFKANHAMGGCTGSKLGCS